MRISPLAPGITLAATPIGNLADASFRLVAALGQADVIAAEDTRRTRQLAAGLDVTITGRLVAFHDHNEARRADDLIAAAAMGERVLVVSDAGMPTISDPGYRLAARAVVEDVPLTVIPGPSAPATALAASGLPTDAFAFDGFLPRKGHDRTTALARLAAERRTVLLFESPHRIAATLADLAAVCGAARRGAVARELTKLHEEVRRGTLAELADWAKAGVRGEIVIVVDGVGKLAAATGQSVTAPGQLAAATGQSVTAPGQLAAATGQSVTAPGQLAAAPGQLAAATGQSVTARSSSTASSSAAAAANSSDSPTGTSSDSPAGTSSDSPAGTSSDSPTGTSSDSPAGTSSDSPAGTSSDSPAGTSNDSPAGTSSASSPRSSAAPSDPTRALPGFPAFPDAVVASASPGDTLDPALVAEVQQLSALGLRMKDAAAHVAARTRVRARDLYNAAIVR